MGCVTSPFLWFPFPLICLKVNNHAANLWKDYYLDHHDRFDVLVSRLAEQPKTVKKPFVPSKSPSRVKDEGSSSQVARKRRLSPPPPPPPPPPRQTPKKKGRFSIPLQTSRQKRTTPQLTASVLTRPPKRPRATFNSLSAPLPSNNVPNLMPPQVDIPLPNPPSRSPTPPAVVQVGTNGNKYTKEDREYFLKFLVWRLKQDPSLTKKEICELLHEKVNNICICLHGFLIKRARRPTIALVHGLHIGINVTTSPTRSSPHITATPRTMQRMMKTNRMRKRRWKWKKK